MDEVSYLAPSWPLCGLSMVGCDINLLPLHHLLHNNMSTIIRLIIINPFQSQSGSIHLAWCPISDPAHLFPHLKSLIVSADIPLTILMEFIICYPTIEKLEIKWDKVKLPTLNQLTPVGPYEISSAFKLSGPPSYLQAILQSTYSPLSLTQLFVSSGCISTAITSTFIPDVLQCLNLCHNVAALEIGAHPLEDPVFDLEKPLFCLNVKKLIIQPSWQDIYLDSDVLVRQTFFFHFCQFELIFFFLQKVWRAWQILLLTIKTFIFLDT